jgi:hypothetical protein
VIGRLFGDRRRLAVLRRIDRPAAVGIAIAQALVAAFGWFADPIWLAVAIAAQLVLGGLAAIYVIGPARPELGLGRYAIPSIAGISATLLGKLIPGGLSLLLVPLVAVLLWAITYLELRIEKGTGGRTIGDLLLTSIVFSSSAGLLALFGPQTWPTPLLLVTIMSAPVALRAAEARGTFGVEAVGQSLLHVLVVAEIGAAAVLLNLSLTVMAALIALAFYSWAGAVDAIRGGASGRSVAIEFGSLMLLGLIVGLVLHRP